MPTTKKTRRKKPETIKEIRVKKFRSLRVLGFTEKAASEVIRSMAHSGDFKHIVPAARFAKEMWKVARRKVREITDLNDISQTHEQTRVLIRETLTDRDGQPLSYKQVGARIRSKFGRSLEVPPREDCEAIIRGTVILLKHLPTRSARQRIGRRRHKRKA